MGCGASKCSHGDDPSPAGLRRPLFRCSGDEIKRRSTCMFGCGTTLSKKELLTNGDADIDDYPINGSNEDGRRSMSSSSLEDGSTRLKVATESDGEAIMKAPGTESGITSLLPIQEEGSRGEEEMGKRGREEEGDDEEEREEDGKASGEEVGLVCPGSPSFREYCTATDNGTNDVTRNNSQSDLKNAESSQFSNSNQGSSMIQPVKKDKKGRRFRRAVMNLMAIKSSPSSSSQVRASTSD
ncbi:hypothetical protein VitviT2T_025620 [Vitis vinifera]|uniref:Uncharacterized protein n=2 Tax=Vitis vinifera TaxID=29760 RepID=F6GT03_VITVI|nr:uncharacterized protein LOC100854620 [Vitis vinifera]RVX17852.1 hypothetical protein CK203_003998 [Vitis vinifera]WKA07845.1 hypothetical protein VitviT2T_025620 [Vitis vinifera]|eukprot:XP_003634224.1 PREDICTED: uncharacterized protein LOC100854620 [Vitis vinifera]